MTLLVALATTLVSAAEKEAGSESKSAASSGSSSGGWFGWMFAPTDAAAKKKSVAAPPTKAAPKAASSAKPVTAADQATSDRAREETALMRRLLVCDKLMQVAFETRNDELQRMAEQLEERARTTYSQRIAHLPSSDASFMSDEEVLEKHLGSGTPITKGPEKMPSYSVTGKNPLTTREE